MNKEVIIEEPKTIEEAKFQTILAFLKMEGYSLNTRNDENGNIVFDFKKIGNDEVIKSFTILKK